MKLWRIATETRKYPADDMSGAGAASKPGRWNDTGKAVIYAAPTIAIAVLETAAYVDDGGLPLNRFLVELDLPDDVWNSREELNASSLPPAWAAIPAGQTSVKIGCDWLDSMRSPVLLVPSVIVPEENAALINPKHGPSLKITSRVVRQFEYNRLFRT
ncbi:RES family NAD+ phosphorylase [Caballeronia sp. S22]|uniref:RES family NAD+ phosphorylase n=1 Tax=Caballeronia sp. S22 TaxID=3137182 RepID=UPI003530D3FD